jgi:hypothetical protein
MPSLDSVHLDGHVFVDHAYIALTLLSPSRSGQLCVKPMVSKRYEDASALLL